MQAFGLSDQIVGAMVDRTMAEATPDNLDTMIKGCSEAQVSIEQMVAENPMFLVGTTMLNAMFADNPNMLDAWLNSITNSDGAFGVSSSSQDVADAADQTSDFAPPSLFESSTSEALPIDTHPTPAVTEPVPEVESAPELPPKPAHPAQPRPPFTANFVKAPMAAAAIEPVAAAMRSSGTNQCDLAQPYAYTDPMTGEIRALDGALLVCTDANGVGLFLAASGGRIFMNDLANAPAVFEAAYGWRVKSFDIGQERISMQVEQ
jgi:hypothetical protein